MDLYLDFDGVILDTIPILYDALEKNNIDKEDPEKIGDFFSSLDWEKIIKKAPQINHSIFRIKRLISSQKFNIKILTHITSEQELEAKKRYIEKYIPNLDVIGVPKSIKKCDFLDEIEDAILIDDFTPNLDEWVEAGGVGIKFGTTDKKSKYIKIDKLDDVLHFSLDKGNYEKHIN